MDDVNELATTLRERGLRMTPRRQQVLARPRQEVLD
jgi:Fe2+ or Zn2+ uptake regulation protein